MQSTSPTSGCGPSPAARQGMASHIGPEGSAFVVASSARVVIGLHLLGNRIKQALAGDSMQPSEGTCGEEELHKEGSIVQ